MDPIPLPLIWWHWWRLFITHSRYQQTQNTSHQQTYPSVIVEMSVQRGDICILFATVILRHSTITLQMACPPPVLKTTNKAKRTSKAGVDSLASKRPRVDNKNNNKKPSDEPVHNLIVKGGDRLYANSKESVERLVGDVKKNASFLLDEKLRTAVGAGRGIVEWSGALITGINPLLSYRAIPLLTLPTENRSSTSMVTWHPWLMPGIWISIGRKTMLNCARPMMVVCLWSPRKN